MTAASIPSPDTPDNLGNPATPQDLLANLKDLTRKVRTAQRGAWFPLLLLGALLAVGIVVNRLTFTMHAIRCPAGVAVTAGGCTVAKQGSPVYWTLGLVLVYAATAVFYIRRSRERGVGSPIRPYLIAGVAIAVLITPTKFWGMPQTPPPGGIVDFWGLHFNATHGMEAFLSRLTGRAISIGLPLLVLAWIERNRALLLFTLVYIVVELIPVTLGASGVGPWSSLSRLAAPALVLLLGALGFGLAERSKAQVSPDPTSRDQA